MDEDPNDPELGTLVTREERLAAHKVDESDAAAAAELQMMKAMLKSRRVSSPFASTITNSSTLA